MWYYIYREIKYDNPGPATYQELGRTRYEDDAKALLARWHSGYISHRGDIIFKKNLEEK